MEEITFDFELLGSVTLSPSCLPRRGRRRRFLPPLPWSACRYVTLPQVKAAPSMTPALRQVHNRLIFWVTFNRIGSISSL